MDLRYEFLCPYCPGYAPVLATYDEIKAKRPTCPHCHLQVVPHLPFFRSLESAHQFDFMIRPETAKTWLQDGFESAREQVNEASVQNYTSLMVNGQWVNATLPQGGDFVPILRIRGTLLLGFNRLIACVQSNKPFTNTVLEVQ